MWTLSKIQRLLTLHKFNDMQNGPLLSDILCCPSIVSRIGEKHRIKSIWMNKHTERNAGTVWQKQIEKQFEGYASKYSKCTQALLTITGQTIPFFCSLLSGAGKMKENLIKCSWLSTCKCSKIHSGKKINKRHALHMVYLERETYSHLLSGTRF